MSYSSDIVLGNKYRDEQTGYEGIATAICFYQHACERVTIEAFDKKKMEVREYTFDAPRLVDVETGRRAKVTKTGGDRPGVARPSSMGR